MRYYILPVPSRQQQIVLCSLFMGILLLFSWEQNSLAETTTPAQVVNTISEITATTDGQHLNITLTGSTKPAYTVYELFNPARIVIDVADSLFKKGTPVSLPPESGVRLETSTIADTKPPVTRFTFILSTSRQFTVTEEENSILLSLTIAPEKVNKPEDTTPLATSNVVAVNDIKVVSSPKETTVQILATDKISSYTYDVLDKQSDAPPRLYVDINNVTGDTLIKEQHVGTILANIRVAQRGSGLRFVFDSSADTLFPFQVTPLDNGLEIQIQEKASSDDLAQLIQRKQTIESQLPQIDPLQQSEAVGSPQDAKASMEDAFSFSGYKKERITVDFYKIDLHNVFRLLREVSNTNIVVDEAVSGSLTLALTDVPWDFALDIILNLKDLQKEERFNTIVIHPKSKAFNWPERAEDNLSFEADDTVSTEEAILISQMENIPKTVVEAKKLVVIAQKHEKKGEYESAVSMYEKALTLWPDSAKIANKISFIYLLQLRQNAKALYFAKKALEIDPKLAEASLNAAIASANMQELKQAQQYFDQSVQGKSPLKEALLSYAVFSEDQQHYDAAISLLRKYDQLYGENLSSMITQARILDKQGKHEEATKAYQKILLSGYRIAPDLKKFIQGRMNLSQSM